MRTFIKTTVAGGIVAMMASAPAWALDHGTVDAAIGGGLGGAAGAAIGNEIGSSEGAIIGGALGAAGGAAITTSDDRYSRYDHDHGWRHDRDWGRHSRGHYRSHCPPGLAMQHRC